MVEQFSSALKKLSRRVVEKTLPNGLRVRLYADSTIPVFSYQTFFNVGSRNERPGITGISHLFEHMMFNGSKKFKPGRFDKILESQGGHSNAYTSFDMTVYYENAASEALETVMDLESDRMHALLITPKTLETERQVVMEERLMRVDNDIMGMMDEELSSLVWKAHPYRWPIIGYAGDIASISREDCLQFFRTYYAPNNASLFIAGDIEVEKTLRLLKKYYGKIPPGPPIPPVVNAEPPQKGERRAEIHFPAQAPHLMVAWRGPSATHQDTLLLDVLQFVLGVGHSSRLVHSLVFEKEVAVSISVHWAWRIDPGSFVVTMELRPGIDAKKAEHMLYEELDLLLKNGLRSEELKKAVNNLCMQMLESFSTYQGCAQSLGCYEMFWGSWREGMKLLSRYAQITQDEVAECARRYLKPELRNVVHLCPMPSAVAPSTNTPATQEDI
ncbi:MAG: insulinase family protein [Cystobacterineae bacterium]|nr:insulinase family protein [Cystobacterineae bacterium]